MHKAQDDYRKCLELDGSNEKAREGLMRIQTKIRSGQTDGSSREQALKDPEVVAILRDPVVQGILQQLQQNPHDVHAREAMRDPSIVAKLERLAAAGFLQLG